MKSREESGEGPLDRIEEAWTGKLGVQMRRRGLGHDTSRAWMGYISGLDGRWRVSRLINQLLELEARH